MNRTTKHSATREVEIYFSGESLTIEAHVEFSYHPGSPATPPCYSHGGLPPDPAELNIEKLSLKTSNGDELDAPEWLTDFIEKALTDGDDLSEIAIGDNEPDEDDAYERARDDARDFA